jgi:hypothetical protein
MSLPFKLPFEVKGAEELPKPEDVVAGLTAFPPKLSVLASIQAFPEVMFERAVKDATGVELPPGPNRVAASVMSSIEASMPAPPVPGAGAGGAGPKTSSELTSPPSREAPTPKRRFELL